MHMRDFEKQRSREASIAGAIRFVERQTEFRIRNATERTVELRKTFHQLLDNLSIPLFDGIANAAARGAREFHPASIPAFRNGCENLFTLGGIFDDDLLNDWLHSRDLRHLFWCSGSRIHW